MATAQNAADRIPDVAAVRARKSQPTRPPPILFATQHSAQSKRREVQAKRKAPLEPQVEDIEEIESSKSPRRSVFSRLGEKKSKGGLAPCVSSGSKRAHENKAHVEPELVLPPFQRQLSGVKEVNDMMVRLKEIRRVIVGGNTPRTPTGVSPFVPEVLGEVLPLGARLPHLESYDGSSDPKEHVY